MSNAFGSIFRLTTFGESHGVAIGGIIDGFPAGFEVNLEKIQNKLNLRRPGFSRISTERKEDDKVEFLSGIYQKKTTGTPIAFMIWNKSQKKKDYGELKEIFRPSHADFTYQEKYGIRNPFGGGRSSARETDCRVVAGALAKQLLESLNIKIIAYVSQIGSICLKKSYKKVDLDLIETNLVRCPDIVVANQMIAEIKKIKKQGDTIGGVVKVVACNIPPGWGEPIFDKLHADIGKSMLSINAVKGFKYGFDSVDIASSKGSKVNDVFINNKGTTKSNFSGGIQGGISNGNDIYCEIFFKPVSTIMKKQTSVNKDGIKVEIEGKGRHDVCVVPRAVPIVEGMLALTLADHYLRSKINKF